MHPPRSSSQAASPVAPDVPVQQAQDALRRRYAQVRRTLPPDRALTLLQLGAGQTLVASGRGAEADAVLALALGADRTAAAHFRRELPTALELEQAIAAVEEEVMPARSGIVPGSALFAADAALAEVARVAGLDGAGTLSLEAVERAFDRLARVAQGSPAAHEGIPASAAFAATLLILREFMHHLRFDAVTLPA